MRNKEAIIRTQTVFLYELDSDRREEMVNELSRSGFRVLCLEYLVQVSKRTHEIEPDIILCSPGEKNQDRVFNGLLELKRSGFTDKYPFMIYDLDHSDPWTEKFLEAGAYNIIRPQTPIQELSRIISNKERINRKVQKTELILEERKTPDGTAYWYIMPKAQTQLDLNNMMVQILDTPIPMHLELVVLRFEFCVEINDDNLSMIAALSEALMNDGLRLMIIAAPNAAVPKIFEMEIACFPSMAEFDNSFLAISKAKSPVNTQSLASLLDQIPDF